MTDREIEAVSLEEAVRAILSHREVRRSGLWLSPMMLYNLRAALARESERRAAERPGHVVVCGCCCDPLPRSFVPRDICPRCGKQTSGKVVALTREGVQA